MNGKSILIVDDNPVELQALSGKLVSNGYDVLSAEDGSAAISVIRQQKPDLILLDIAFPPDVAHGGGVAWDGFLILSWVRRIEEAKTIPVIFITGGNPEQYKERALAAGAVSFFQKPYDTTELLGVIRQSLDAQANLDPQKANHCDKKR